MPLRVFPTGVQPRYDLPDLWDRRGKSLLGALCLLSLFVITGKRLKEKGQRRKVKGAMQKAQIDFSVKNL